MISTLIEPLNSLRKVFDGELVTDEQAAAYDSLRSLWNTEVDKRPAVIARCVNPSDVVAAVNFGRERGLEISVRCGSHNAAGTAGCTDGVMVDLSLMRSVVVDPAARRVRVAGGALLGDMDAATQQHGLATTAGTVSHTGVGGLTLGGGSDGSGTGTGWPSTTSSPRRSSLRTGGSCAHPSSSTRTSSGRSAVAVATSGWSPSSSSGCTRSGR